MKLSGAQWELLAYLDQKSGALLAWVPVDEKPRVWGSTIRRLVDAGLAEFYMPGICRECGACEGGCSWVEDDLCSACAPDVDELAARGLE